MTAIAPRDGDGAPLRLELKYTPPLAWPALIAFLGGRGAASVEAADAEGYRRTVRLGDDRSWLAVRAAGEGRLVVELAPTLAPWRDVLAARLRALLDLDADPAAVAAVLGCDARLAGLVVGLPGLRVPGAFDGFELALRAILGQQVTVRAATTLFTRFAERFGEPLATPHADLRRLSPEAPRIAGARLQTLIDLGLTERRARTIHAVARACADGALRFEPGPEAATTLAAFEAIPGIGPWTANYVAMRALRLADAFPHGDLALCKALGGVKPREALARSQDWRPWRAYAALYLWHGLNAGGG